MPEIEDIPIPKDSGSSGLQKESSKKQTLVKAQPFSSNEVVNALEGIAASNTRSLGGEVGSALLAASMKQLAQDNHRLRQENTKLDEKNQHQQQELETARTRAAVLQERLIGYGKNKHLRNFGIAVGIGLLGIGINLGRQEWGFLAVTSLVAGALLTLLSWFSGPDGDIK